MPDEDGKKVDSKIQMKMQSFERINLIFEFSISKLSYEAVFMKIPGKNF